MRRLVLTVPLALLLALPAAADAARSVPYGFYGMNWDGQLREGSAAEQRPEWDRMAATGVESVRTVFSWRRIEPTRDGTPNWSMTDTVVELAARRRIDLVPVVLNVPDWARAYDHENAPPRRASDFAAFLRTLVQRYGSKGTFWENNPDVPRRPVRWWQIFNETELYWQEAENRWGKYAKVIKASYRAVHGADRRGRLVLAGSFGFSWDSLTQLYKRGVRGHFDVAAIHPYTGSPENVMRVVRKNRIIMRKNRDRHAQLWITELSWPASKGRADTPEGLREVVTNDSGMASRLRRAYSLIARSRGKRDLGVARVYWYTWASPYRNESYVFDYAGLLRYRGGDAQRRRAFYAYRAMARRHQGCVKTKTGRCR